MPPPPRVRSRSARFETFSMNCSDPADVIDVQRVCGDLTKRNGVCEDGGEGSEAHSVARGFDCQDCGPRDLDSSENTHITAYGLSWCQGKNDESLS